ncbi:MAG: GIY-YIG nuclease family protein [Nanoarchaeota archaeon]
MPVIYKIYFKQNPEKIYIGSATNFSNRKIRHTHQLKKGTHNNLYLQRLYKKYGHKNLIFEIIEKLESPLFLIQREQFFINSLKPQINILKIAGSALGYKHSDKTKQHISKINFGRKMTPEQIKKGVIARIGQKTCLGYKRTEETKKKISEIRKKKVRNLITNEIFDSIGSAAKFIGLKYQTFYAKISHRNFNNTNMELFNGT